MRIRVPMIAAAAFFAALPASAAEPAPQEDGCAQLRRVVLAATSGFAPLRGAPLQGYSEPTWMSQVQIFHQRPRRDTCRVDRTFWCTVDPTFMTLTLDTCLRARPQLQPGDNSTLWYELGPARISLDTRGGRFTVHAVPGWRPPGRNTASAPPAAPGPNAPQRGAVAAAPTAPPPARSSDTSFCGQLEHVIAMAGSGFEALKGARVPNVLPVRWTSQLQLPFPAIGSSCRIDERSFTCSIVDEFAFEPIRACLRQPVYDEGGMMQFKRGAVTIDADAGIGILRVWKPAAPG